ncbi:MAG: FUN14 domain-containing protein [Thermoproteota archaeon]|nr:FUN14 domain-containing protein [Thermoproteota archaeon]
MTTVTDLMPFAGTVGGGFLVGLLAGYAIKKVIKIVTVIIGLLIAALAYLGYQRIIQVDWENLQTVSQNGITMLADAVTHIANNIGVNHMGISTNLASSNIIPVPISDSVANIENSLGNISGCIPVPVSFTLRITSSI